MNFKFLKRGAALALVAVMSVGTAQAAVIEGVLNFTGEAVAIPGPGIGDAFGLSFTTGFLVTTSTGAFAANGVDFGDAGTIADFFFDPLTPNPVDPLLTIVFDPGPGKFAYVLESIEVSLQNPNFLNLTGTGTLTGTGLDSTAYDFSMSVDGSGGLFGFSGTLSPSAVVPIPAPLVLFLSGLLALGVRRRG